MCSDPIVLAHFPGPQSRTETDQIFDLIRTSISETGVGFPAIERKDDGGTLGFCGLKLAKVAPALPEDTVEIGWRLAHRYWGQGYVTEAAHAMLDYGFTRLGLPDIVSFAVSANARSLAVMERIGMQRDPSRDFQHPHVPDSHPHLKTHVMDCITEADWSRTTA